ncbi:MAG: hypothetical protein A2X34_01530 [Elusimicrobia bacterium GWC2_51_8]|nr:MAG: hypothetical protein A2X33_09085 [Elusimicrobia bacterium GWA2_51_34]OGR65775.1 MAG: hypothetical protein A2X34_01530 [Elusimicrobia bacterium GWC2_51_8]OGR88513.1 MAG: hypothetical protein A2021_03160 [Elusimicrobia bacterium GWF2_52_66]HCE97145.1 hypothetical protein [Elusimicrobiota bacterium]
MKTFFKTLIAVCPVPFVLLLSFVTASAAPSAFAPALLTGTSGGQTQNKTEISISGLATMATGYSTIGQNYPPCISYGDFDEFNNINDPLFREGSKALLRTGFLFLKGEAGKAVKAPVLRDAPSDTGTTGGIERGTIQQNRSEAEVRGRQVSQKNKSVIKKRKTVKPLRVDPLKSRNIIQLLPVV